MNFEWQFRAACGYAELGMTRESIAELDAIECRFQNRPEVLQLRLHHLMHRKSWLRALTVSRKLVPGRAQLRCWLFARRILSS